MVVAIRRRGEALLTEVHARPGVLSVMLNSLDTNGEHRSLQAISAHFPSMVGHPIEEAEITMWHSAALGRGHRRKAIYAGLDTNSEFDSLAPRESWEEWYRGPHKHNFLRAGSRRSSPSTRAA